MLKKLKILDFFAGLGGELRRKKIESRGHEYVTLDMEAKFNCDLVCDIFTITPGFLNPFHFDFIWASPPCEAFSVASMGHHWGGGKCQYLPKTPEAVLNQKIVEHTIKLISSINPQKGWLMENPRGVLRKLPCVSGLPRTTVCYCRYGDTRMKPTDLWGKVDNWTPREMCHNGNPDHEAAPRGSKTGTQGMKNAADRAVVPWELWEDILVAIEK